MTTVAIIAPGAMGSAVGRRLRQNGVRVLTVLKGRSAASIARAKAAGMQDVDAHELVEQSDFFLSIVPPADARAVAVEFASHAGNATKSPLPSVGSGCWAPKQLISAIGISSPYRHRLLPPKPAVHVVALMRLTPAVGGTIDCLARQHQLR